MVGPEAVSSNPTHVVPDVWLRVRRERLLCCSIRQQMVSFRFELTDMTRRAIILCWIGTAVVAIALVAAVGYAALFLYALHLCQNNPGCDL
jgi:hypothetical protein